MRRLAFAATLLFAMASAGGRFAPSVSFADRVLPKKGPILRGSVSRTDTEVVVNRYRARAPLMTYGVVRLPLDQVKKVEEEVVAEEVVRRRADDLKPMDVAGRVGLAKYAISQGKRPEANRLLEEALALDVSQAEALELYGGRAKFDAARRGQPALDAELRKELLSCLTLKDGAARLKESARLEADRGYPVRPEVLDRMRRSLVAPRGVRQDVPLALRADRFPGSRYSIHVPATYDPLVPCPLLLALHDGGAAGKDGTAVVGSGREGLSLYLPLAQRFGWIVVAPTALAAPWTSPANEPFLASVLEEVTARYAVDLDRVFVTGHGMGGTGAWVYGTRRMDQFAGVGASSCAGLTAVKGARDARCALFVYHAADDPVVPVGPTHGVVDALLDAGADLVYLQLEDRGHSYPEEAESEMFDLFRVKRLFDPRRTSAWPRSSFTRKPSPEEVRDLGDPAALWAGSGSPAAGPTAPAGK